MVTYSKEELVGVTEFGKSMGAFLDKVISNPLNKIALVRRNRPEAVIVPIEEYERMQELSQYLEHKEIYDVVQKRVKTGVKCISQEEMFGAIDKRLKDV